MLSTVLSLPNGSGPSGMYPFAYAAKTFPLTHILANSLFDRKENKHVYTILLD